MSRKDSLGNDCQWRVRLHMRSLGSPRVPEFNALRNAQATYGPHGILIEFASGISLPDAVETSNQSLSLERVDVGRCVLQQRMTNQQDALFAHGGREGVKPNEILCYWVQTVLKGTTRLAGCASHPSDQPACVVAAGGSPWTLAHEVGHVLGLSHVSGHQNLMSRPTASIQANPPQLSESEVTAIKRSPCCVKI